MPIKPIVLQRRHAELGRIRLGAKKQTSNGKTRPAKLETFRFTSPSERYISDLAALYGGQARKWDNGGKAEYEVYTEAKSIPVIAVKGGLSQWMETWSGGGCVHRCDGEQGADGSLCNPDDPAHQEAKPTTRLSVMLPELEAIGVWRMESHGWNAAAEIPAVAELAQYVGDLVPAHLHLVERRTVKDGQTSRFVVPVLDLQIGTARLKEIVAEKSGQAPAQIEGQQPQRQAIEAGPQQTSEQSERSPQQQAEERPTADTFLAQIPNAQTLDQLTELLVAARGAGFAKGPGDPVSEALVKRKAEIERGVQRPAQASGDEDDVVDGEVVDETPSGDPAEDADADRVWEEIVRVGGQQGMTLPQIEEDFAAKSGGVIAATASGGELQAYLEQLRGRAA